MHLSGFESVGYYSPLLVLFIGLATSLSLLSIGRKLLVLIAPSLSAPWLAPISFCLGVLLLSLCVQALAFAAFAYRGVLITLLGGFVAIGCLLFPWALVRGASAKEKLVWLPAAALLLNLVIAIGPSSKIDELYYHMLLPARIVADHGLVFYREPWPAAVLPHMGYQIALAPLHAIHFPDSGNVVSWFAAVLLARMGWQFIERRTGDRFLACAGSLMLTAGLYPTVHHVTSGPHALGDLAVTAAILLLAADDPRIRPNDRILGLSILAVTAAATKISLWPLGALLLVAGVLLRRQRFHLYALAPLLFLAPVMIFSYEKSGSPFGPILAGSFGPSLYERAEVGATLASTRSAGLVAFGDLFTNTIASYPIHLWVALGLVIFRLHRIAVAERVALGLLILQASLVITALPLAVRFLGGAHYAVALIGITALGSAGLGHVARASALLSFLPWFAVSAYYTSQFLPYSIRVKPGREFYERYVALYRDFEALDRLLPRESNILLTGCRCPNYYAPRRVYLDPRDLPALGDTYLVEIGTFSSPSATSGGIYFNPRAVVGVFRTPGRSQVTAQLRVLRLPLPKEGHRPAALRADEAEDAGVAQGP